MNFKYLTGIAVMLLAGASSAETIDFDEMPGGQLPKGWLSGSTGGGSPHWSVEADKSAPSKPNVF